MDELMMELKTIDQLGEDWIQAIVDQDFEHLAWICHPDVKSTLMVPSRIYQFEKATDLSKKVEDWFDNFNSIEKVQTRVRMVGQKLGIFYRLRCVENGEASIIEQQIYCSIRAGRIEHLRLICSGFQADEVPVDIHPASEVNQTLPYMPSSIQAKPHADALQEFEANGDQGSTCALLTPLIKHKLTELSSGQVLEVHVNDTTAKDDIESWSRLSGNSLLKMDQEEGRGLVFYILKK